LAATQAAAPMPHAHDCKGWNEFNYLFVPQKDLPRTAVLGKQAFGNTPPSTRWHLFILQSNCLKLEVLNFTYRDEFLNSTFQE